MCPTLFWLLGSEVNLLCRVPDSFLLLGFGLKFSSELKISDERLIFPDSESNIILDSLYVVCTDCYEF